MAGMYGHDVAPRNDRFVAIAEETMSKCLRCILMPASLVVNAFPLLRFLPSWFPGASFKRKALEGRYHMRQMINLPVDMVEKQMVFVHRFIFNINSFSPIEGSRNSAHVDAGGPFGKS
jgi:hypothetical protein